MALRVTGVLGLDGSGFFQTMTRADAAVRRFSTGINSALTSRFAALFSVGAMGYAIKRTVEYGGKLTDLAARTGATVEELQRFDMAAKQNGSSLESLISFWERLDVARAKALKDSGGTQANAFSALGVGANDLATKSAQDITRQISIAFKNSTNVEELIAPLQAVGGRGAMQLAEAFATGMDSAYEGMSVMSAETADIMDEVGDRWMSISQEITTRTAPALVWILDTFRALFDSLTVGVEIVKQFGLALAEAFKTMVDKNESTGRKMLPAVVRPALMIRDFFKTFQEASARAHEEIAQVQLGVDANRADSNEAMNAARAARIARRRKSPTTFEAFDADPQDAQISRAKQLMSDSLVRTGNFLGTNRNVLESLANRQVMLLVSIDRNTKKMADKTSTSDELGIE